MPHLPRRVLLGGMLAAPAPALAQSAFPNRPVRLIVPFAAGGSADVAVP